MQTFDPRLTIRRSFHRAAERLRLVKKHVGDFNASQLSVVTSIHYCALYIAHRIHTSCT